MGSVDAPTTQITWLCAVGLTVAAAGLTALALRKRPVRWLLLPGLAVVVVCAAAGLSPVMTANGRALVLAPAAVVIGFVGLALFRYGSLQRPAMQLARALSKPAVPGAALLASGLGLALFAGVRADIEAEANEVPLPQGRHEVKLRDADGARLRTDRGRPIAAFQYAPTPGLEEDDSIERQFAARFADRLIRRTEPDPSYNCHGFTFTDGRYWIKGSDVETILTDNGYQVVRFPRLGDVVVYRDMGGLVSHTGVVRTVLSGGKVLVESKWGRLGRFLHPHDAVPYPATTSVFYHSPRFGRLLQGLPRPMPQMPGARAG
jgi:hypothetical protein